jgi:hypothetical protein
MDYWLDRDQSGDWSWFDYIAWHGIGSWGSASLSPFAINDGEIKVIDMLAIEI